MLQPIGKRPWTIIRINTKGQNPQQPLNLKTIGVVLEKWSSKNIALMQFIHLAPLVPCLWSKHYKDDCSGESAYPPPARHRFDSPARCQTWLCFLSDSALTLDLKGFFFKGLFFPYLTWKWNNNNNSCFISDVDSATNEHHVGSCLKYSMNRWNEGAEVKTQKSNSLTGGPACPGFPEFPWLPGRP